MRVTKSGAVGGGDKRHVRADFVLCMQRVSGAKQKRVMERAGQHAKEEIGRAAGRERVDITV